MRLASEELYLTDEARYVGYATAFEIPMPPVNQPAKRVHDLIMLGSLPPRVRELYGLRFGAAQRAAFSGVARALRTTRPLAPRRVLVFRPSHVLKAQINGLEVPAGSDED